MQKSVQKSFNLKKWSIIILILIYVLAVGIRFFDLKDIPLDFHPARQFHSAIIARGMYTEMGADYPEWQAKLHRAQNASEIRIEPPIMEYLTALGYRMMGQEQLWIARIYSILFWLLGGVFIYLSARKISGQVAGLAAAAYFLLLPYAILASRSFQPDPLMIALTAASLYFFLLWDENLSWKNTILAGLFSGLAILVKQVAVFFVLFAFAGLLLSKFKFTEIFKQRKIWVIGVLSLFPVVLYNLYGIFIEGTLAGQYSQRFFPELFADPGFYIRWLDKIDETTGFVFLLLALMGCLLIRKKEQRALLFGFLAGYLLYGFVFAHHISTHDYYQLPLIVFCALGVGVLGSKIFDQFDRSQPNWFSKLVLVGLIGLGAAWCLWNARSEMKKQDFRAIPMMWADLSREVGGPQTTMLALMEDYGSSLSYWGYIIPEFWWAEADGRSVRDLGKQQFEQLFLERAEGKQFFVITDFAEMKNQSELRDYLAANYAVYDQNEFYLIYDLQQQKGE